MKPKNVCLLGILVFYFLCCSIILFPVVADEDQLLDSFDVIPESGRWTVDYDTGFDRVAEYGYLRVNQTGTGAAKGYHISRGLSGREGRIEVCFRFYTNGTTENQQVLIQLIGESVWNGGHRAYLKIAVGNYSQLCYYDTAAVLRTRNITTDSEKFNDDEWYTFQIDYNIPRSELSFSMYNGAGARLWKYEWYEIVGSAYRPIIFQDDSFDVGTYFRCQDSAVNAIYYLDFIRAPFNEQQWFSQRDSTDTDWYERSWQLNRIQDDIDDYEYWHLNVPYLDSIQAQLVISFDDLLNATTTGENASIRFAIYEVDSDDGTANLLFYVKIVFRSAAVEGAGCDMYYYEAGGSETTFFTSNPSTTAMKGVLNFEVGLFEERNKLTWQVDGIINLTTTTLLTTKEVGGSIDSISAIYPSASQEFILETFYDVDFDFDTTALLGVSQFTVFKRDLFAPWAIAWDVADAAGEVLDVGESPGFFESIVDGFVKGMTFLFGPFFIWLGGVFRAVGELIIEPIQEIIDNVVSWFLDALGDFIGDAIAWLVSFIADVIDLLALLIHLVYDWIWEDLLSTTPFNFYQLMIDLFDFVIQITNMIQNIIDIFCIVGLLAIFFLPLLAAGPSIGEFFEKMLDVMGFDCTLGITVFGVGGHLPLILVWCIALAVNILDGTVFAGFLTW